MKVLSYAFEQSGEFTCGILAGFQLTFSGSYAEDACKMREVL